jgi:hypothetical protein
MEACRTEFIDRSRPFISALRPKRVPGAVVYPFGGSDLLSALVAYPDASEITTISLEGAGDPRRMGRAGPEQLRRALSEYRALLIHLLRIYDNQNAGVRQLERGIVPNQLAFSLAAARVYGYRPVSLKYFRIEPDGTLHYYTGAEIAEMEKDTGRSLRRGWAEPDYSVAFRNMELVYAKQEDIPGPGKFIHRHVASNLHDSHFAGSPLETHLRLKGRIAAITKAASYLLWRPDFSAIRGYLLSSMEFMVSDSTGILPRDAVKAGFEVMTYGKFNGAFLDDRGGADADSLRALWRSQPYRPLPFRFGYSDIYGANHMMITRPAREGGR